MISKIFVIQAMTMCGMTLPWPSCHRGIRQWSVVWPSPPWQCWCAPLPDQCWQGHLQPPSHLQLQRCLSQTIGNWKVITECTTFEGDDIMPCHTLIGQHEVMRFQHAIDSVTSFMWRINYFSNKYNHPHPRCMHLIQTWSWIILFCFYCKKNHCSSRLNCTII